MHLVALLWGVTGVLGAAASVDSSVLTAGRAAFALITIVIWFKPAAIKSAVSLQPKILATLLLIGVLLGIHWIFFFLSINKGGVAIGLVTYATTPTLIAIGEVLIGAAPLRLRTFFAAILSFVGVFTIHPIDNFTSLTKDGLGYGLLATLAIGIAALLSKRLLTNGVSPLELTLGQLTGALVVSLPIAFPHLSTSINAKDWLIVAGLGIICSAFGQTLFNKALMAVSVSTGSIIASMEAPYGVLLAKLLISQPLTLSVIVGVLLVTVSAILVSLPPRSEFGKAESRTRKKLSPCA